MPFDRQSRPTSRHPADRPPSLPTRLLDAWEALDFEQRLAGGAASLMFITMFFPWYQQNAVVSAAKTQPLISRNLSAFAVFSFVEAADLLVALAILFLLFARAERRSFHLPGGDGTVVLIAGIWTAVLLVWRLFDKPGITRHGIAANVGIQWGIFFALASAGLLAYAGSRMRAARQPEPPLLRSSRERPPRRERSEAPREADEDPTAILGSPPPARRAGSESEQPPRYPPSPATTPAGRDPRRPRSATRPATQGTPSGEQLSFEDSAEAPRASPEGPTGDSN
jgi:hypothetical protein